MQKWVVEILIDDIWVQDGFNLTQERLEEMILNDLSSAYRSEISVRILEAPNPKIINKIQGDKD